jgi:hypothetical protein
MNTRSLFIDEASKIQSLSISVVQKCLIFWLIINTISTFAHAELSDNVVPEETNKQVSATGLLVVRIKYVTRCFVFLDRINYS